MWKRIWDYFDLNKRAERAQKARVMVSIMAPIQEEILYCKNGEKTKSYPSQRCPLCKLSGFIVELFNEETNRLCSNADNTIVKMVATPFCVRAIYCPQCGAEL